MGQNAQWKTPAVEKAEKENPFFAENKCCVTLIFKT
jgi:hypothetical protein